jgi:hypothetical protein
MDTITSYKKTNFNYYEKQKFRNVFLFTFLILLEGFFVYVSVEQYLYNRPLGFSPAHAGVFIAITLLVPTPLLLGFYFARFDTIINENGIFYRWVPFKRRYNLIEWNSIKELSIIDLKSAGLSWMFSGKYKEVQYLGGGFGLHIRMKSGRRRIIGTRKPEELNRILIRIAGPKYSPSASGRSFEYD